MRLLKVQVVGLGPFESQVFPFNDEEDRPRHVTVVQGGGGVGKTSLLHAIATTRPGHAVAQMRQREPRIDERADGVAPHVICEWVLGQDDPTRPHGLVIASPNARVLAHDDREALRRREQTLFDRVASEGGFAFLAIPSTRWFSRQPIALTAPSRVVARYDVKAAAVLDDASRSDLSRDTKQALSYAAIAHSLATPGLSASKRFERLGDAMREAVERMVKLAGFGYHGVDAFSLEPLFRDSGGRLLPFDALPTRARHLVSFAALSVRTLWAAYPERDPRESEAVIVIDEVDLHQDAGVQAGLVTALASALPEVQWIITTNSPLIAAACEPREVLALRRLPEAAEVMLFAGEQALTH